MWNLHLHVKYLNDRKSNVEMYRHYLGKYEMFLKVGNDTQF